MVQALSPSILASLERLRDVCHKKREDLRQRREYLRQELLARGLSEREIDDCDFRQLNHSEICVRVLHRDRHSTNVKLKLPPNATARDAMEASGLLARDGTPYRCFDADSNVIDDLQLQQLIPSRWKPTGPTGTELTELLEFVGGGGNLNQFSAALCQIFVGIPREIEAVMIEETTYGGRVGKGHLLDGSTILIPEATEGEFAWIVVSARHHQMQLATGFKIPYERTSYSVGDVVHVQPSLGCSGGTIFNPKTCKFDLWIQIKVPRGINRADYDGLMWTVRINGTTPLVGTLDTKLTPRPKRD